MAYKPTILEIAAGGTNASSMATSTGIVKYDGTRLVTSSTVLIDSSNRMTNSGQPCFSYYLPSLDANATGDATLYVIGGTTNLTKIFDNGNNMNVNGTFTAPITGNYFFTFAATFENLGTCNNIQLRVVPSVGNGFVSPIVNPVNMQVGGGAGITMSCILSMTANETMTFDALGAGTTKTVSINGGVQNGSYVTYVQGYLLPC